MFRTPEIINPYPIIIQIGVVWGWVRQWSRGGKVKARMETGLWYHGKS
jgi:hypothetical protein